MFVSFATIIVVEAYRYYIRPVFDAISFTTARSTMSKIQIIQVYVR